MTDTDTALQSFHDEVKALATSVLKDCLEDYDPEAWGPIEQRLADGIVPLTKDLLKKTKPVATQPKSVTATKKTSNRTGRNPYAQWVKAMSHIRNGTIDGEQEVEIGDNFKNKDSVSAKKYYALKDELNLHGENISVKSLLSILKDKMPDVKDMTITAMSWGLVDEQLRKDLVVEFNREIEASS